MASAASDLSAPIVASPELISQALELIPIPSACVVRDGTTFALLATNRAYRQAGLGEKPVQSSTLTALGMRIDSFLRSPDACIEFDWQHGHAIDCRHYRVTLARTSADIADRCQICFIDRTSAHRAESSLRREMTNDSLTGLPNREGFGDLVEERVAAGARTAVLVVDLERFGRLNACLGSLAGDELLITVARRLKGALRTRDVLARIGGDEFGILMTIDEDPAEAHQLAKRIRRSLTAPFRLTDYELSVQAAIGIAYATDAAGEVDELIRHAQFAVKRAKATGDTEAYQIQAFALEREQFGMETALRRAIENRRLRLTYQPICDLATGRIVAFEALTRWLTDDDQEIAPDQFVPVAEESGLIVPLGRWAIEEATRTLAAWDARAGGHCGVHLAVNLSPIQLQRDSLTDVVEQALAASGLKGERLKLELTESALVTDPERTAVTLRALKALGTTLAMDDFGTGYSNLAYLQTLPIDVLKIDRSFVTGMLADRDKTAIVRAILSLAQALNMRTVAEGIETLELAQTLGAMGCNSGQGYYFARPLEAEDAWAMIAPAD
jgi:diguanylate cyclase (GGDEF)-like protein